jgi:hypothetical protein
MKVLDRWANVGVDWEAQAETDEASGVTTVQIVGSNKHRQVIGTADPGDGAEAQLKALRLDARAYAAGFATRKVVATWDEGGKNWRIEAIPEPFTNRMKVQLIGGNGHTRTLAMVERDAGYAEALEGLVAEGREYVTNYWRQRRMAARG